MSPPPLAAKVSHGAFEAIHHAYARHYPLVLSPDIVWALIAQGFAQHIRRDPERWRSEFVDHTGSVRLRVERNEFERGAASNDWPAAIAGFGDQIRQHVGDRTYELLVPTFSTTGPLEKAAVEIVLMNAMQSYFEYTLVSMCGIPRITLEGTPADWEAIARRAQELARFDLDWWIGALAPVLDQFVAAAHGRVDRPFWQSIYKPNEGSGQPYICGWIVALFPYLRGEEEGPSRNPWLDPRGELLRRLLETPLANHLPGRPTSDQIPNGMVSVPVRWEYRDEVIPLEWWGGFAGVRQDRSTLDLRPELGWVICDLAKRDELVVARLERSRTWPPPDGGGDRRPRS